MKKNKQQKLNQIAKNIIKNNIYLTLATSDKNPWAAPLYYCTDKKNNFYYISQMDCVHTQHILKNPTVAFAIFDSTQKEGTGNGVQGSGKTYLLERNEEIEEALKYYHTTYVELKPETFKYPNPYRMFKLIPSKFYVLDSEAKVDKRVEVMLLDKT